MTDQHLRLTLILGGLVALAVVGAVAFVMAGGMDGGGADFWPGL